jgi:hypothetical protein
MRPSASPRQTNTYSLPEVDAVALNTRLGIREVLQDEDLPFPVTVSLEDRRSRRPGGIPGNKRFRDTEQKRRM